MKKVFSTKEGREFASREPNEGLSEKPTEKRKVRSHQGSRAERRGAAQALGLATLDTYLAHFPQLSFCHLQTVTKMMEPAAVA